MKPLAVALMLFVIAPAIQDKKQPLPAAEASKLRTFFTEALAKNDSKSRATLTAFLDKLEAKYVYEDLRKALSAGPLLEKGPQKPRKVDKKLEEFKSFGPTTVGYSFACSAGVFRYAVDCPASYDPTRPTPVLLDPGHGIGAGKSDAEKADFLPYYRGQCVQAGLDEWLIVRTEILEQVGADGMRGALPEDQVAGAFQALWRDVASRWCIDLDRIYVAGLSQTGFWSWYLGRASADRYAGIAPMSSVTWQVDPYAQNFLNLPIVVVHGEQDKICPVPAVRGTCTRLQQLRLDVKYIEIPGAGHGIETWSHLHEALEGLAIHPRRTYLKKVAKYFQTLEDPWCGFVCALELESLGDGKAGTRATATLEAEIEGQVVRLKSKGIRRARVCLSRELVDCEKPIEVLWNEKRAFQGKLTRDLSTMLDVVLEKVDWMQAYECALEVRCP